MKKIVSKIRRADSPVAKVDLSDFSIVIRNSYIKNRPPRKSTCPGACVRGAFKIDGRTHRKN